MSTFDFINELKDAVKQDNKYRLVESTADSADLIITDDKTQKTLVIETKDAGGYGQLPLYTAVQINKIKSLYPNDKVILFAFSDVTDPLNEAFRNMDVQVVSSPTIAAAKNTIDTAFESMY